MSFIGDLGNTLKDLGGAAVSSIGVAWDWAKARNDDFEEWQTSAPVIGAIKRAGNATRGYLVDESEGMRNEFFQPLKTVNQAATIARRTSFQQAGDGSWADREKVEWGTFVDPDTWSQAWADAEHKSIGQTVAELSELTAGQATQAGVGGMTDAERDAFHKDDLSYHVVSGGYDAGIAWYYDPLNVGGKVIEGARTTFVKAPIREGEDVAKAIEPGGRLGARTESIIGPGTKDWDAEHFRVGVDGLSELPQGAAMASALAKATRIEDAAEREKQMKLVIRVLYGNDSALPELVKSRVDIADQLVAAKATRNELLEASKWKATFGTDVDKAEVATRLKNVKDREKRLQAEADRLDSLTAYDEAGDLTRPALFGTATDRTLRVTYRSAQKAIRTENLPISQAVQQDGLWNLPTRILVAPGLKLGRALATMRPRGYVFLDDPNSAVELRSMFDQVPTFDPAKRNELMSKYIEADGPGAKLQFVQQAKAAIIAHKAQEMGYTPKQVDLAITSYAQREKQLFKRTNAKTNERYSAALSEETGLPADTFVDEHGVPNVLPMFDTHLANAVPTLDIRTVNRALAHEKVRVSATDEWMTEVEGKLGAHYKTEVGRKIAATRIGLGEVATDVADTFNKWWKFSVLFRLGYPIRVLTDDQMRIFAKLGSSASALQAEVAWSGIKAAARGISGKNYWEAKALYAKDLDDIDDLTDQLDEMKAARETLAGLGGGPDVKAEIAAHIARRTPLEEKLKELQARAALGKKNLIKTYNPQEGKRFGEGEFEYRGITLKDAIGGPDAALRRDQMAATFGDRILHQGEINGYARTSKAGNGWATIEPTDPGHAEAWLNAVNYQLQQSKLAQKILAGQTDDQIITWLRTPGEGRDLMKQMAFHGTHMRQWIANARQTVDQYVPAKEWREILQTRQLRPEELATWAKSGKRPPAVNGALLEANLGTGAWSRAANKTMSKIMHVLGELPSDKLSRAPLYTAIYRQKAKREIDRLLADPDRIKAGTADKITEDDLKYVYNRAHSTALKELKSTLYDITAHSNAAEQLRFISPFMGAWQETLMRWWNLAKDKPQIVNYFNMAWQMPNKTGMVVNREGEVVDQAGDLTDDEFIMVQLPSWAGGPTKEDPTRGQVRIFDSVLTIPKSSFNLVLQGDPWYLPGFGPIVQAPIGLIAKEMPEIKDLANFINPLGTPDSVWDTFKPATLKRLDSYWNGLGKRDFASDTYRIYGQMHIDWEKAGEPDGWDETNRWAEAEKRAKSLYLLKATNNFLNPFPATFRSPYQFWIDEYHRMQEEARRDPNDEKTDDWVADNFIRKHGEEFFTFVQSSSKNNMGLDPSVESVVASRKHDKLIEAHPDFARQIVGKEGVGEYEPLALSYQRSHKIRPGSEELQRESRDPREARAKAEAATGWVQYQKLTDGLNAVAVQRGLTNYREDKQLSYIAKLATAQMADKNHAWRDDFNTWEKDKFDNNFQHIDDIAFDKSMAKKPETKTLQRYVALRRFYKKQLDMRAAAGGSSSYQAKSNRDLMFLFTHQVYKMAEEDMDFDQVWFTPKLERDPMLLDLTAVEV